MGAARVLAGVAGVALLAAGAGELTARLALRDVSSSDRDDSYLSRRWQGPHVGRAAPTAAATAETRAGLDVAVVGGAVTAGRGLLDGARFPVQLERRLRELGVAARVRSHPIAEGATPASTLDALLEEAAPDLVLLEWSAGAAPGPAALPWLARHSALYAVAALGWAELGDAFGLGTSLLDATAARYRDAEGEAARASRARLDAFFTRAREADVAAAGVLFPDLAEGLLFDHPLGFRVDRALEACRAAAVACLDLRAAFAVGGAARALRLSRFDRHPGPAAHRIAAEALLLAFADRLGVLAGPAPPAEARVPLWGLFETSLEHPGPRANPFAELSLEAVFLSPSGRMVRWFGFYDGEAAGGGSLWRQRFMPDELGTWSYLLSFSDGGPWQVGSFACVSDGARPGPWRQDPVRHRWLRNARGEPFLPTAFFANAVFAPEDWRQAIEWAVARGYDTLVTPTLNAKTWGEGWRNVTPFEARDEAHRQVDYTRPNLRAWRDWDALLREAGEAGIYVAPFEGPAGDYGGQSGVGTVVPPPGLEYGPGLRMRFDDPRNLRVLRAFVARQGAFWNLAYWNLYSTEIHEIKGRAEVIRYLEVLASWTPFGRMITAQDIEQGGRRWLTEAAIPRARKLHTYQLGTIRDESTHRAGPNHEAAAAATRDFPALATESLWEGQPRANRPLRVIWGALTAGAHTVWADWSYDDGVDGGRWGSMGRGWTPLRALDEPVFGVDQLGVDTAGDELLPIATAALGGLAWWRLDPRNDLVAGGAEAYGLAEPGVQYLVYAPEGGEVALDLRDAEGELEARWLDPATGIPGPAFAIAGGQMARLPSPGTGDRVLLVQR